MNNPNLDNRTALGPTKTIATKLSKTKQFGLAGLCCSVLALAACQPTSDESTKEPDTQVNTETPKVSHNNTDHDDSHNVHNTNDEHNNHDMTMPVASTDFGKEYLDSMDDMHEDMTEGSQANDADVAFAKGMIPHHKGAVDMAEIQLKYGKDQTMRKLAEDIIAAQGSEIKQMENWLEAHPDTEEQDYTKGMHKAYADSMKSMHEDMMQGVLSEDADMAFAKGMLPHHQGAVAMAEVQIKYGKDKQMRKLAQDIIDAQKSEIDVMQKWIKQHS